MNTPLTDLLARRTELDKQISEARRTQRADAIAQIKALMAAHDLSIEDVSKSRGRPKAAGKAAAGKADGPSRKATRKAMPTKGRKVAVKYRDKASGDSWTGRGLKPRWLTAALAAGKKLEDFAV